MSWEARIMRSRASFFNKSFSLHLLRRFWPLWLLWLCLLLLAGPINLSTEYDEDLARHVSYLCHSLLDSAGAVVVFAGIAGALMAMAMLSWLYSPRLCGLVASLPMRRETAYATAVLTGLVPMLLSEGLVCLVMLLLYRGQGVATRYFLEWLGAAALAAAGFYGFACFCALLTGNALLLPAVYGVLLFAAPLAEAALRSLFGLLLYGYSYGELWLERLSPPVWLMEHMQVKNLVDADYRTGRIGVYTLTGLPYLAGFAIAGLTLSLLGVLILKKRHMETAGESVAVPVLRPVFRACMGLGVGLVGAVASVEVYADQLRGAGRFVLLLFLLCFFGALGWFAAEMLVRKTLRVFGHGWRRAGLLCACLVTLAVLTELDVTGYEKRLPRAEDVVSVDVGALREELTEPESLAACLALHESLIAHKAENEDIGTDELRQYLTLDYTLKNGKTLRRAYSVACGEDKRRDPDSAARRLQEVMNLPEARRDRVYAELDISAADIREARVSIVKADERGIYVQSGSIQLTAERALSLYREGVLPDTEAGRLSRRFIWTDSERAGDTNVELDIELWPEGAETQQSRAYSPLFIGERVQLDSENTLRWLKDNLGMDPQPLAQTGDALLPYRP